MLKSYVIVGVLGGLCVVAPPAAQAQDRAGERAGQGGVEVTSYVFAGSNLGKGVGTSVRWPMPGPLSLELETNYRQGEIGALSSHLSLISDLPSVGRATPYVAAGIGLEQYGTYGTGQSVGGKIVARTQTALVVNAGGGVRVQAGEKWGVRSDARYFNGLGSAPERFRVYNGVTFRPSSK